MPALNDSEYVCDVCGQGKMVPVGECLTVHPPKYLHRCAACGCRAGLNKTYLPAESDAETKTPGGPPAAEGGVASGFSMDGNLVVWPGCGCELVFSIASGFKTAVWMNFCDAHSPIDRLDQRNVIAKAAARERDRRLA